MFEIFQFDFMQRALIAGLLIAIISSVVGSFIVLKRYAIMSDTLAHVSLVGVAVGIVLGQNPLWMAVIISVIVAWLIEYLRYARGLYSDAVMAVFLSGSLAVAVIIVSMAGEFNTTLFSYLFGNILTVSEEDIVTIVIASSIALIGIILNYHKLFFIAFDEEVAKTAGINVPVLNFLLITVVALVVALSIRVVGSLLIGALMVIPALAAMQFKLGFFQTILISMVLSVLSVVLGLLFSYLLAIPSGASIVVVALFLFVISILFKK